MRAADVQALAHSCGFELAGVTAAAPVPEATYYRAWVERGYAGEMRYLTDYRADLRGDPRSLLPAARSILCVGKLYNSPRPDSERFSDAGLACISRYAWGQDYHDVLRNGLGRVVEGLRDLSAEPFEWKICVDTAPLLERAYARHAGLGWIGKNTCLINQGMGSWFFLGELLLSLELEPGAPPPDRCGSCTRCIDACPTQALVPTGLPGSPSPDSPSWALDSTLCISYFTIELRGPVPAASRADIGRHVFGCDICQQVCPWNNDAPVSDEPAFADAYGSPPLAELAALSEGEFQSLFRGTAVRRARYSGFLRNVAIALGNSRDGQYRAPLEKLAASAEPLVADAARWGLAQLPA
jgi:epoxyqueuosine reductase